MTPGLTLRPALLMLNHMKPTITERRVKFVSSVFGTPVQVVRREPDLVTTRALLHVDDILFAGVHVIYVAARFPRPTRIRVCARRPRRRRRARRARGIARAGPSEGDPAPPSLGGRRCLDVAPRKAGERRSACRVRVWLASLWSRIAPEASPAPADGPCPDAVGSVSRLRRGAS
jgi:hypothetical protein